jgi:hypothetical protein
MSAKIVGNPGGVVTIEVRGKLSLPELIAMRKQAAQSLKQQGGGGILILAENFGGWQKEGDWGDLSGQNELDPQVKKLAVVGDRKWEDLVLIFLGQGLRRFPIEYFEPHEMEKARTWVASP